MNARNHPARTLLPLGDEIAQLAATAQQASTDRHTDLTVRPAPLHLELRQISGLTAGATLPLAIGRTGFGPNANAVGFELVVDPTGHVDVVPREATIRLDGVAVLERTSVGDATIDTGCARFVVERAVPNLGRRRGRRSEPGAMTDLLIPVPDRAEHRDLDAFDAELRRRVLDARRTITARQRRSHPDPVELLSMAGDDWDASRFGCDGSPSSALVCVAHADVVWQPRFDGIDRLPTTSAKSIDDLRMLVAGCVTADLGLGPLAIVGRPNARRAAARHLMISLAIRHRPSTLDMAVVATREHAEWWKWADALPHTDPHRGNADVVPLLFIDGASQLEDTLAGELVSAGGAHAVILADEGSEVSLSCSTTMIIANDATASVIDHRSGETRLRATPLGFTESAAAEAARKINSAYASPLVYTRC